MGTMKNHYLVFVIVVVLLMLACSAGCSSRETPPQREPVERPSVTMTKPTSNADHQITQTDMSIASPSITRPQVSPGQTFPAPTGTAGSRVYENVSDIMVTVKEISAAWDPDDLNCNAKSCTAGFVKSNGDYAKVQTTLYDSIDSAKAGYSEEKQKDAGYRIIPLEFPDESYGWMQKSQSGVVVRMNNAVVTVDYTSSNGPASIAMAKEFAVV